MPTAGGTAVGSDRVAAIVSGALVAGLLAGYGVAVPVGAIAALIVSLTARTSLKVGAAAGVGAATADGLFAVVAVVGGAALTRLIDPVAASLRWVAAAVLFAMAAWGAVNAIRHHRDPASTRSSSGLTRPLRAFLGVLGLTVLNPATIVYFGALVLGGQAGGTPATKSVYCASVFLASASWQLFLAGGGTLVGRVLTGARGRLATAVVSSAVIVVLAARLAFDA